ncbi:MAG: hypothetical protein CSA47_01460 [Gammaproteobacteria bacterium]|nr:MAG: hypothetical protein CSA47_01460 [Gammaproteobacteria bacterium]
MVFDFFKKQFIDVIEWDWQDDDVLMWQFPLADNEIQNGASLTVRDGQMAIFVNEGKLADVFEPGHYVLNTDNLPLLTNLKNWDKAFKSPFKSDVLFFDTRIQQGRKWGTSQPVTVRDAEFGMVRLRAFGMYAYRIADITRFYQTVSGVDDAYRSGQIEPQLRNLINANLAGSLGNSKLPFIDLAANQVVMGEEIKNALQSHFASFGLQLDSIVVENVSLPDALQKTLDKRISMGMIGDLNAYTQYQTAESIPLAAQNEGGMAGIGAGLGVGMNMGQVMGAAMMGQVQTQPQNQQQPSNSHSTNDFTAKLTQLKTLLDQGLISQADYDKAKAQVLAKLTQ